MRGPGLSGLPSTSDTKLPKPSDLLAYAQVDAGFPQAILKTQQRELSRNYAYQMVSLLAGWLFSVMLVAGTVFLVYTNHPTAAGWLIGTNAVGLATRILSGRR